MSCLHCEKNPTRQDTKAAKFLFMLRANARYGALHLCADILQCGDCREYQYYTTEGYDLDIWNIIILGVAWRKKFRDRILAFWICQ